MTLRLVIAMTLGGAAPLAAQAPAGAGLWRVATASLARPPALVEGPAGLFWNPAATLSNDAGVGIQAIHTPEVLGLSGVLAGAQIPLPAVDLTVVAGRIDMRDLIRTTTSPASQGEIPVFTELLGLGAHAGTGHVGVAAQVRVHESRFDAIRETGVTIDVGARATPHPRVRVAAATHLLGATLVRTAATELLGGVEVVPASHLAVGARRARIVARYGVAHRDAGDVDHSVGLGGMLDGLVRLDLGVTRESAYGRTEWRPAVELGLTIGRYRLGVARGEGLNDIGTTYRILFDVDLTR